MKRTIVGGGTAEIEVGKVYLNRLGLACRIMRHLNIDGTSVYWDETGRAYQPNGRWRISSETHQDLIQELEPQCDTPPK